VPFEVACSCGQVARGIRQARFQVVTCAGCGEALFVLPVSAYSAGGQASAPPAPGRPSYPLPFTFLAKPWGVPLLAAVLTLAGVTLVYAILLPRLKRPAPLVQTGPTLQEEFDRHREAGLQALSEGSFRLAIEQFDQARQLYEQHPQELRSSEGRRVIQLHREASLLAALLRKSLEEVLHEAAGVRQEDEWRAQFRENYLGRSVIFDDVVRREADGRCALGVYEVRVNGVPARLELGELKLLQGLPLETPRRVLFGARVADIRREPPGVWVIRFAPESGVLLTSPEALAACSPLPLDGEMRQLLDQQTAWMKEAP
jgi:hypothetical protein